MFMGFEGLGLAAGISLLFERCYSYAILSIGSGDRREKEREKGGKLRYSIWEESWKLSIAHGNSAER